MKKSVKVKKVNLFSRNAKAKISLPHWYFFYFHPSDDGNFWKIQLKAWISSLLFNKKVSFVRVKVIKYHWDLTHLTYVSSHVAMT